MRFRVEAWSPEYGASGEATVMPSAVQVEVAVERPAGRWAPVPADPRRVAPGPVFFVDGVRRVDARIWITAGAAGEGTTPGVCASWAAGVVEAPSLGATGEPARVVLARVGRGCFAAAGAAGTIRTPYGVWAPHAAAGTEPEALLGAVHERMARTEVEVAEEALRAAAATGRGDPFVVVDGTLRERTHLRQAVGLVKSHTVAYLPDELHALVGRLAPGERTPVFCIGTSWTRYSWYLRLPGGDDAPWAGVVRGECPGTLAATEAIAAAETMAATLGRFASAPHKDPRAPQNLYPIGGLERDLRRRLGDPALAYRALRVAAGSRPPTTGPGPGAHRAG